MMTKLRLVKTLIMWIAVALDWIALELILYGEVQPRIVDGIMWILLLPYLYDAMRSR